jgi:hypothetical protein
MHVYLFAGWWKSLSIDLHIFLSISVVFSTLLIILYILSYFRLDNDLESSIDHSRERSKLLSARYIISFFTLFGWSGTLLSYSWDQLSLTFLYSFAIGVAGTLFFRWLSSSALSRKQFHMEKALSSTGKVLSSIPPHRNGFGKVHLHLREAPFEIDAVTAGQEVPRGASVKVVDILDEKIVLVEPIIGKGRKMLRNFDTKATRSAPKFHPKDSSTDRKN